MYKAIIFDVGGVLVRTKDWSLRRQWESKLGLVPGESDELVFGQPMGIRAQLGEITTEELWQWIGSRLNLSQQALSDFRRDFWANDELDVDLVRLIQSLRSNGYLTGVISNSKDSLRQELADKYKIAGLFDTIVCSAEEGIMKPEPEIFHRALQRLGTKPTESLFVDDSIVNIQGAEEVGIKAVYFTPEINLRSLFRDLGIGI